MKKLTLLRTMCAVSLLAAMALAAPARAQMGQGMTGGQKGMGSQQMSGVMHDMAGQMRSLAGEMAGGNVSAERQKQMGERMRSMAGMLDDMSGMAGRGMMVDPGMQKRMTEMRRQMDEMMRGSPAAPGKK